MEITTNRICENCGCIIEETDGYHIVNDELLCDDCFDENFVYCEICGEVESIPDATYVANVGNVCSSCISSNFTVCYHCDEYVRNCDTLELANGHLICDDCYSDYYFTCERCGEVFNLDNREYIDGEGDLCPECAEQFAVIGDYHHTRAVNFFPQTLNRVEGTKYIGFELEVEEYRGNKIESARKLLDGVGRDFIECKHDGSLNDGFEIVSQPATYSYLTECVPLEGMCKQLASEGMRSHDTTTCGLHFHVSRDFFTEHDKGGSAHSIAKLVLILDAQWDNIVKFSRRNYNQLDRWAKKNVLPAVSREDENEFAQEVRWENENDRYQALNITNRTTLEFRFFRGTLNPNTFLASLEFVELLTNFVVNHSIKECYGADWWTIFEGASENFVTYCNTRGICRINHDNENC